MDGSVHLHFLALIYDLESGGFVNLVPQRSAADRQSVQQCCPRLEARRHRRPEIMIFGTLRFLFVGKTSPTESHDASILNMPAVSV